MKFLGVGLVVVLFAIGCGGGSGNGTGGDTQGVTIQVTSPAGAAAVDANLPLQIAVSVTNDPANAGVTWTVSAQQKGDPAGTLSDIKTEAVTYIPPANITAPIQVTVRATSVTDPTRSAAIPISVYPQVAITTQSSDLATAFLNTAYTCIQHPITNAGVVQIPCQASVQGGLGPYTWTADLSALPPGLQLSPGLTVNDTKFVGAPNLIGIYPFRVTVTDSLGGTSTTSLNINVSPGQLKVVTPTLLTTAVGVPYAPVVLQTSGGVPPYTWTVAPGSGPLPAGMTLSPSGVIAGTPATGGSTSFAIQVRDSQSPVPAQAIYPTPAPSNAKIITLSPSGLDPTCVGGGNTVATGTPYAFLISGFDAGGPVTISGSFTADSSGALTGVEDIIRTSGIESGAALAAGSSIIFNQTGRGCVTLNTASSTAQFRVAPTTVSSGTGAAFFSDGRILEFDDNDGTGTRAAGFFRQQDPAAFTPTSLAGAFAFRLSGWNANGGHFAMAGTATANSGLLTSISADMNDAGAYAGPLNGGSGTISTPDANGRGTATLSIGTTTYDLLYYMIDSGHLVFNSTHAATNGHPLITGEATASPGPFSQASLADSHIFRLSGSTSGSSDVGIGVLHFDGIGAVSGNFYEHNGGTSNVTALSAQYSIDPMTGRFVSVGTGIPAVGYAVPGTNGVTGYFVGTGATAMSGVMEYQTNSYPPGYQFSPINGRYGFSPDEMLDRQTTNFAGQETLDPNGGITPDSYIDTSRPSAPGLVPVQTFTLFRYTWAPDGSGTFGGNTYMVSNAEKAFYIDVSPANTHPAVIVGQRQQKP
ncbi:MAG: putative Ig domain-containing protein [Acidobacteria bacterium]|nr:putative Ig domain-containing protein [Acidobacteriota bacterium]